MNLTIVIPVYNEEENLSPLAQAIIRVMAEQPSFTILFVDDEDKARIAADHMQDL